MSNAYRVMRGAGEDAIDFALDMVEIVAPVLGLVALLGAVIGGMVWGAVTVDRTECRQAGRRLAVEARYDFPSGCYYRIDGRWVPADVYRVPEPVSR